MRQIVLDTETTGREPELGHRIIEIGAIVIQDREITDEVFHTYLNPKRESEAGALAVHGLTQTFLQDKPLFSEVVDGFLAFLMKEGEKNEVIIHNAKFDTGFFDAEIHRYNAENADQKEKWIKSLKHHCEIIDSLKLARKMHPNQRNSLDALCKRYNVDNSKRNLHGALLDAELLAQVYLKMTSGQSTFFDMFTTSTQSNQHQQATHNAMSAFNLPVHYANETELKTHHDQLALIKKESGLCLWESE